MLLYFLLGALIFSCNSFAINIEQWKIVPGSETYQYTLVDLGETDVPLEKLAKFAMPNTLAPQINNCGEVILNRIQQGYFQQDIPVPIRMSNIFAHCHGLNDNGDLLLSYGNTAEEIRWAVASKSEQCKQKTTGINLHDLRGKNVHLRALNDNGLAIGCFKPAGMWRPMIWSREEGLRNLGFFLGWDIKGQLWGVNSKGSVTGLMTNLEGSIPIAWNKKWGLARLSSFSWNWRTCTRKALTGTIEFDDLVIAEDDRIFGTFHASTDWEKCFTGAYWWDPHTGQVRALDLKGMRLNAINSQNTLVGSLNGKAALYDLGGAPVLLEELIPEKKHAWELLDASDINDNGDIVGYAIFQGKMHYYLLHREDILCQ